MHITRRVLATLAAAGLFLTGCAGTPVGEGDAAAENGNGDGEPVSAPGYDAESKTITVGSLVPTSGIYAPSVSQVRGQEAWFHRATSEGGPLEGYTVEVQNLDSQYDPSVSVNLYGSMRNDVLMISNVLGSEIVHALLPSLESDNMIAVPGVAIEDLLDHPNVAPFGPVYAVYHTAAIEYFANEMDLANGRYCTLLQDDEFGDQVEEGFNFATEELGLETGTSVRYPTGHQDFTPQISRLKADGCDVVDVGGAGATMQQAATRAVQLNFDAKWIAGHTAYTSNMATGPAADYLQENVRFFVTGTEWGDGSAEGQVMMEEDLAAIYPDHEPYANSYQTGYMAAMVTTAIIEQSIEDGDLSREHLMEVAASLGEIDDHGMGGGPFHYGDQLSDRRMGHGVSVFTIDSTVPTGLKLDTYGYDSQVAEDYNQTHVNQE